MYYFIYEIENIVTGFKYIGCSKDYKERWKAHISLLDKGKHKNKHFQNAWNKYGIENFRFSVLHSFDDETTMYVNERIIIEQSDNLYNKAEGGLGGDYRKYMTDAEILAYRLKLSQAQKLSKSDPIERAKCNAFVNLTESEYANRIKVWSDCKKGLKNKNSKYHGQVAQLDINTNEVIRIWNNIYEASDYGYNKKYIVKCCNNIKYYDSHKGFKWKWVD